MPNYFATYNGRTFVKDDAEILTEVKQNLYKLSVFVIRDIISMYSQVPLSEFAKDFDWDKTSGNNNKPIVADSEKRKLLKQDPPDTTPIEVTTGISIIQDTFFQDATKYAPGRLHNSVIKDLKNKIEARIKQITQEKDGLEKERNDISDNIKTLEEKARNVNIPENGSAVTETPESDEPSDNIESLRSRAETIKSQIKDLESVINTLDKYLYFWYDRNNKKPTTTPNGNCSTNDKNQLVTISIEEWKAIDNLRTDKNDKWSHDNPINSDDSIEAFQEWKPNAMMLAKWAEDIMNCLAVVDKHYSVYSQFDSYFSKNTNKDKFDHHKIEVQRQIENLFSKNSNIILEFNGKLYEKYNENRDFDRLVTDMAENWEVGKKYLTIISHEDMPELNEFFKDCLSGTNKYLDFVEARNQIRSAYKRKNTSEEDLSYFKMLYKLVPDLNVIYWKGTSYTEEEFAKRILHRYIRSSSRNSIDTVLRTFEHNGTDLGINLYEWSENRLLSDVYFKGKGDKRGQKLARDVENAVIALDNSIKGAQNVSFSQRNELRSVIAELYFYMIKKYSFYYSSRWTGKSYEMLRWNTLDDYRSYMENMDNFANSEHSNRLFEELEMSPYFKKWEAYVSC